MTRVVDLRKAVFAGVAGAIAWEAVLRGLALAGLPLFDIVRGLGTLAFPDGPSIAWWLSGMAAHALVGALWGVFYAYFFWARRDWRPVLQGLAFSVLPAFLAMLLLLPQLELMHRAASISPFDPLHFFATIGWRDPAGLLLGNLVFGAVVGGLYTRPVGYPADRQPRLDRFARRRRAKPGPRRQPDGGFIFATGIECSDPRTMGGGWRRDEMHETGHYRRWQEDFELAREIGVTHLRYGPPLHLVLTGPGRIEWDFVDATMAELEAHGPEPIVDLCHFGLPAWLDNFQNPELVEALAFYAGAFAERYPWVRLYTPINEMYVCARLSCLDGLWNEQARDDSAFVTAVRHMAKASARMSDAILGHRPNAVFINSESGEYYQPCCPDPKIEDRARLENERRFLPLDLLLGRKLSAMMHDHVLSHGMAEYDLAWFMEREVPKRTIVGIDYYEWNEKLIDPDGHALALGELFGWSVIARQYYDRYRRPMMHTETNRLDASEGPRWLWRQWHNVQLLRQSGVPLVGFTWYSLTDQIDWDIGLARPLGTVNPVGLFDLNRDPRAVGLAYHHLIDIYREQPDFAHCPALAELLE